MTAPAITTSPRPDTIGPAEPIEPPEAAGSEEIEKHIEKTRDELGQTVAALADKLDRARTTAKRPRTILIAVGALAVAVAGVIAWTRTR